MWKNLFKFFVAVLAMCPLSMIKNVDALNFVSSFALLFVIIAVIGIIIRFAQFAATDFTLFPPHDLDRSLAVVQNWPSTGKGWR